MQVIKIRTVQDNALVHGLQAKMCRYCNIILNSLERKENKSRYVEGWNNLRWWGFLKEGCGVISRSEDQLQIFEGDFHTSVTCLATPTIKCRFKQNCGQRHIFDSLSRLDIHIYTSENYRHSHKVQVLQTSVIQILAESIYQWYLFSTLTDWRLQQNLSWTGAH